VEGSDADPRLPAVKVVEIRTEVRSDRSDESAFVESSAAGTTRRISIRLELEAIVKF